MKKKKSIIQTSNDHTAIYREAKLKLVAKSISELCYEEILTVKILKDNEWQNKKLYELDFEYYSYTFLANKVEWDSLIIEANSIKKIDKKTNEYIDDICPFLFFKEAQQILEIDDITLAHFTEEMHQTLFADCGVNQRKKTVEIKKFHQLKNYEKESLLNGHPKILLNKGRLGFNSQDFLNYTPEYGSEFQLNAILIKKEIITYTTKDTEFNYNIYLLHLFIKDQIAFNVFTSSLDININEYVLMPIHPWQLDKIVKIQFYEEIVKKEIVIIDQKLINSLFFAPQISLRTLTLTTQNIPYDFKLSLNILNTSAYRGMNSDAIESGYAISPIIEKIFNEDPLLKKQSCRVLKEIYGLSLVQNHFSQIPNAPYRYHELLSFVLRENGHPKFNSTMAASLFYTDCSGNSYAGFLIKMSNLSATTWIELYAQNIIIPLYHLQLKYGIGLVAHGQNVQIELEKFEPKAIVVKDFQGDLRLQDPINPNLLEFCKDMNVAESLLKIKKLPAEHLIHDLITGHFVTHLRFLSQALQTEGTINENEFYSTISDVIYNYLNTYFSNMNFENDSRSLLRRKIERIILNKVRFKLGYTDTSSRLAPLLGTDLINPLHKFSKHFSQGKHSEHK